MPILLYFYSSNILNSGLLLVTVLRLTPPHLHIHRPSPHNDYSMVQLSAPALLHQSPHLSSILQSTAATTKAQSALHSSPELHQSIACTPDPQLSWADPRSQHPHQLPLPPTFLLLKLSINAPTGFTLTKSTLAVHLGHTLTPALTTVSA